DRQDAAGTGRVRRLRPPAEHHHRVPRRGARPSEVPQDRAHHVAGRRDPAVRPTVRDQESAIMTSHTDLLSAARTVGALAARHAPDADTDRRLRPEVVEAVVDAGFPGHFVPTRWGGRAGTFA